MLSLTYSSFVNNMKYLFMEVEGIFTWFITIWLYSRKWDVWQLFFLSFLASAFFFKEIKHVFHGLQPVRGLILFLSIVCRLAVHMLLGSSATTEHSCLELMIQEPPSVLSSVSTFAMQIRPEAKAVLRLTNLHLAHQQISQGEGPAFGMLKLQVSH